MKVLLVDNDMDFLETRAEFLTNAGYQVLKASTLEEARRMLSEEYIHLAILDIRMVDDDDAKDISGLTLAQDPAYKHITKIIFTGFPSYEYAREAMKPSSDGLATAVTFLAKKEGAGAMVNAVREALKDHVRINTDLRIRFRKRGSFGLRSFAQLSGIIAPELENSTVSKSVNEIEDLFRKLFYSYTQVTLSRVLWQTEPQVALEVFAYTHGREEAYIVLCGQRQKTAATLACYNRAEPNTGQVQVHLTAETMHFVAIAVSLNGVDLETLQSFATFYKENTGRSIRHCVDTLIQTTLVPWQQQTQLVDPQTNIIELFRERTGMTPDLIPRTTFDHSVQALAQEALLHGIAEIDISPEQLTFSFPGKRCAVYPNPGSFLYEDDVKPIPWKGICETAAGDLNVHTILVEPSGQLWLTDLRHTQAVPAGYNLARFETSVRFSLIPRDNLQTLEDFEAQVLEATLHGQRLRPGDVEPAYRKALIPIQDLRQAAKQIPDNDMIVYHLGLFFGALTYFAKYNPDWKYTCAEITHFLHALLFSAMLREAVDELLQSDAYVHRPDGYPALRVDVENQVVWVGDHSVPLPQTEFDLLAYLYQHAEQLCKREDILRDVFDLPQGSIDNQASLINTNIGRLRKKVEFDSRDPQYIITVWGQGYKLITQPG
jgi:DNA-binding response OmpR family regulator